MSSTKRSHVANISPRRECEQVFLRPRRSVRLLARGCDLRPRRPRSSRSFPATSRAPSRRRSRPRSRRRSRRGEHLLAEAGTGTGKSLAYLIPALDSGQRVVVSTATKALQEQLLDEGRPDRRGRARPRGAGRGAEGPPELPLPPAAAGLRPARRQLFPREEDAPPSRRCATGSTSTETGDRAELDVEPPDAVWAEIAVGADRCLGRRCAVLRRLLLRGRPRRAAAKAEP